MKFFLLLFFIVLQIIGNAAEQKQIQKEESPWLLAPLVSSSPKLGTSVGALTGYLYHFDKESPISTFAFGGIYTSTDSYITALGGNLYFDKDRQRLIVGLINGKINNEYNDFLGTGFNISSTDHLYAGFMRYTHSINDKWYIGAQIISTDYAIVGDNLFSNTILNFIGLTGFKSNGVGAVIQRDTLDNQNSPSNGSSLTLYNLAYRKALGGEENFDVYTIEYTHFIQQKHANVLALRFDNRWAVDAPPGAYSSINLPGYTVGEYLAPYSILFEAEERMPIKGAFGFNAAIGIGCLYGDSKSCTDYENIFPSVSAGISYMIKKKDKMVIRADFGAGKDDNIGFYIKLGQSF